MSISDKGPFIIDQFRAAGRLVNEWRDTIFYAGLAMAFGVHAAKPINLIALAGARELIRSYAWKWKGQSFRIVGEQSVGFDKQSLVDSALSVAVSSIVPDMFLSPKHGIPTDPILIAMTTVFAAAGGTLCAGAGGPVQVFRNYRDIMWDCPRKNGGNGPTQTEKFKDGIKSLFARAKEAFGNLAPHAPHVPNPAATPLGYSRLREYGPL
jgi:hypothetical protein